MNPDLYEIPEKINPFIWNYYIRRSSKHNKYYSWRCKAVKFTGRNLEVITQPTGIIAELNFNEEGKGILSFKRTHYSPLQNLHIGDYLTWDGKRFMAIDSDSFHALYRPRFRK